VSLAPGNAVYNLRHVYSAQVLNHSQNPRNAGEVANPDAVVEVENPACADVLPLSLKVSEGWTARGEIQRERLSRDVDDLVHDLLPTLFGAGWTGSISIRTTVVGVSVSAPGRRSTVS
jgi:hypothetical protein